MFKKIIFGTVFLFMTCLKISYAKPIPVPEKIDFSKFMASFSYSHSEQSVTGKKISMDIQLMANGWFDFKSVYIGQSFDACSERGGEAAVLLSGPEREALMKLALNAYNENQAPAKAVKGTNELGPQLSVEYGQAMGNTSVSRGGKNTEKFYNAIMVLGEKTFTEEKNRPNGLEMQVGLDKEQIIMTIKNIGKSIATILLPDNASEHFFYRKTEDEIVGLKYATNPPTKVFSLKSGQSFKVWLKKPDVPDLKKILFQYDNMAVVYNDNPSLENTPKVQICSRLK